MVKMVKNGKNGENGEKLNVYIYKIIQIYSI